MCWTNTEYHPRLLIEDLGILVGSELTQNTFPLLRIETSHGGLRDLASDLTQNNPPSPKKTLCVVECETVCGDYRCIPRGYCLVFSIEQGLIQTRYSFSHLKQTVQTFL